MPPHPFHHPSTTSAYDVGQRCKDLGRLRARRGAAVLPSLEIYSKHKCITVRLSRKGGGWASRLVPGCRSVVSLSHFFARPRCGRWVGGLGSARCAEQIAPGQESWASVISDCFPRYLGDTLSIGETILGSFFDALKSISMLSCGDRKGSKTAERGYEIMLWTSNTTQEGDG